MMSKREAFTRLSNGAAFALRSGSHRHCVRGPTHVNPGIELTWVEHGAVSFELPGSTIHGAAGSCIVLPAGLENTPMSRAMHVHQLLLPSALLEQGRDAWRAARALSRPATLGPDHRVTSLMRMIATDLAEGARPDDPGLFALIDALLCRLGDEDPLRLRRERRDPRVRRALSLIESRYAEPLSVEQLAEAAEMSAFAFSRAFRAQVGESPYRYLVRTRLTHAAHALRSTRRPVLEIALASGFGDPGRFARAFRSQYGCTPRDYRG